MKKHWKNIRCSFDRYIGSKIRKISIPLLRISLGIVFLWFGLLKVFNVSPWRLSLKIPILSFLSLQTIILLGFLEFLILIAWVDFKKVHPPDDYFALASNVGDFWGLFLNFRLFCESNPLILTLEGEFVLKNLVLVAGSLVVIGYKVLSIRREWLFDSTSSRGLILVRLQVRVTENSECHFLLILQQRWIFLLWKSRGIVFSEISLIRQVLKREGSKSNWREFVLKKSVPSGRAAREHL